MAQSILYSAAIALFWILSGAAPAEAQATRTWVSGVGDDANPCSRTAPCKTFAGAISKTLASGEINCLDPGGFGALTITKAITISCEAGTAGVVVSGTNGINVAAGSSDTVVLRGLDFEGLGQGLKGISFTSGAFLHVDNCRIRNFTIAGLAITSNQPARFMITGSQIIHNGSTAGQTAGILIKPTGASVLGDVNNTVVDDGSSGVIVDSTGGVNVINVTVQSSAFSSNRNDGVGTISGNAIFLTIKDSVMSHNDGNGINNGGSGGAQILVAGSAITGNTRGVAGSVQSYLNNVVIENASDGTMTPVPGGFK